MKQTVRAWRLWGMENHRLDCALTALAVAGLLWSRFAFLASGPWEWDETLFARGILHFEMAAHFPHPPGFPGWLLIGRVLLPLAKQPLIALQWASAISSVLCLWPLAALGRRVAPGALAAASAFVVLVLPGPWLFAVRGFSSTTAALLAFSAGAVWAGGLTNTRRVTAFTLMVVGAFLVRPILLPVLAVLWTAGISSVRPWRRCLPGLSVGVGAIAVSVATMAWLEGGWAAYFAPIMRHAGRHASRLYLNEGGFGDLGIVKGAGGSVATCVIGAVALVGVWVWGRRVGLRAALLWVVVLAAAISPLVLLQNRTYSRYSTPVQMAVAPLLAGAATLVPLPAAGAGLAVATGFFVWRSMPLLEEQHETRLAAWEATVAAEELARSRGWAVVVEPEIHPFASYLWHLGERRGLKQPSLVLSPWAPETWAGVDRPWVVATVHRQLYLPSLSARELVWGGVSDRLFPLTQQRFLAAAMIENAPLPVGAWWPRETLEDSTTFMWAGAEAELWLPPVPQGTWVGVDFKPAVGAEPLLLALGDQEGRYVPGDGERQWMWFSRSEASRSPAVLRMSRSRGYSAGAGDDRELSVQVFGVKMMPPGTPFAGPVASGRERGAVRLFCEGCYGPEAFGTSGSGVWLDAQARLRLVVDEPGQLTLRFLAPRPSSPDTVLTIGGNRIAGPLGIAVNPLDVVVDIREEDIGQWPLEIGVSSVPFVPAQAGLHSDRRHLGVVLLGVGFEPVAMPASGWWSQ